ncbi:T9SS type B sorting domain-containing protein [Spirosoma endbachense]|uniref:T9SS type B sorting domain-containing protein n=1 Tax=Spirosoma endbachense TaxID=2666025 RepID=A0A6P1VXL0_9BACT|nr:gliding motility-associated C-terminal domain-containing protein [Spirosoma endbachense]QHV96822.1 T9SS type B sorting domain-containing protein [Spirosoma endbachense]
MNNVLWLPGWLLFCLIAVQTASASHIAGGNIEFVATDKPNQFQLSLNLYIDEASKGPDAVIEPSIIVSIFRSQDNQLMGDYTLKFVRRLLLVYANPACARTRGLETSEVRYSAQVQLDASQFSDPAGYYVVWEKCCRNKNVVNIRTPEASGMIYYLAFPPLLKNGTPFRNSSPVFLTPNAEYICLNKPFSLAFRATDADGDELRYSLTTPYNDNVYKPAGFNNSPNSPAYRLLRWMPGYSEQVAITGNPPLRIDRSSGVLTVQPDQLGLFAFTVLCEEYRQGIKIGEVRRDHQILVVDCSAQVPPKPSVAALDPSGQSPLEFCQGSAVLLKTDTDTTFNYQWRRDGYNLPGETKSVLRAIEPGDYSVIKSFAIICTRDSASEVFRLTLKPSPPATINAPDTVLCPTRPLVLTANQQADFTYQWSAGHQEISGATNGTYTVNQAGQYRLKIYNSTTNCISYDSILVTNGPLQKVMLAAQAGQMLCEGNDLVVTTTNDGTSRLNYSWLRNNVTLPNTSQSIQHAPPGDYVVTVTDPTQCAITSASVHVNPRPHPLLDSLPPICGPTASVLPLSASPPGGTFSGPGVTGDRFDPAKAGVGQHLVHYSVTNSFGCLADTSRLLIVLRLPIVDLGPDQEVRAGGSVLLTGPTGPNLTYTWETDGLQPLSTSSSLTVRPKKTAVYKVTVWTNGGCPVSDEILIDLLPGLFIPTAFSPNGDGLNDSWAFSGIGAFPACSVRIYNRWGELIYQASPYRQPWDGTYRGNPVGPGLYTFVVRPAPDQPEQTGTLTVLSGQ